MNTKRKYFFLTISLISLIIAIGCSTMYGWPKSVPDGDIIFQSIMYSPYELYFVQADGSKAQMLKVPRNFVKPIWSSDGKRIYGLFNPRGMPQYDGIGYPAYWNIEKGSFTRCSSNLPYYWQIEEYGNSSNPNEVILHNIDEIILFDMKSCREIKKFVDYTDHTTGLNICGFSYFAKTEELLFGEFTSAYPAVYRVVKLNLNTGKRVELAKGVNPAWSPDRTKFAYVGLDGLYIMQANENQPRQLIKTQFFDPKVGGSLEFYAPLLRWSPDGEWLLYHQCVEKICQVKETRIFKIRVSDGSVENIFIGGEFPSWIP
jgi:Tol biopolymer transport system component